MKLHAFQYGRNKYPAKFIFKDDVTGRQLEFAWMFYLIETEGKRILIDTGFANKRVASLFKLSIISPIDLLKNARFPPTSITDIIITHNHFDHTGCLHCFPNAHVHMHKDIYIDILKYPPLPEIESYLKKKNRLSIFNGDKTHILPEVTIASIGGHSPGSSVVYIETTDGKILIPGDEIYLLENLRTITPVGTYYQTEKNKAFIEEISRRTDITQVLTFHEPSIMKAEEQHKIVYRG